MTGCNPGCNSCNSCRKKERHGSSVMREHSELFTSPVHKPSQLGRYTPLMRKDTFLHRMSYNPRPFVDQTRDHSALLVTLLNRISHMSPNDARYATYQKQIDSIQQQLTDLKTKHEAMMQGRNSLISYVTANSGNLVPADAIGPILTGDWSSFRPPILSPESEPQPRPTIAEPSMTMPPGPIGSLENTAQATEEGEPANEVTAQSEDELPHTTQLLNPELPHTSEFVQNDEELPHTSEFVHPTEMPTQEEDDKSLYTILAGRHDLSKVEQEELNRILRTYPKNSDVFADGPKHHHQEPASEAPAERLHEVTAQSETEYEPTVSEYPHSEGYITSEDEAPTEHEDSGYEGSGSHLSTSGHSTDYEPEYESEAITEPEQESDYEPPYESESGQSSNRTYRFLKSESESEPEETAQNEEGVRLRGPRGPGADKTDLRRFMEAHNIQTLGSELPPWKQQKIGDIRDRIIAAGFTREQINDWILQNRR